MDLVRVVETAKRRDSIRAPSGEPVIEIRIDGSPSHLMSNAVAAFQSELEDLFLLRARIVGGGAGCLYVEFGLGPLGQDDQQRIGTFFDDAANLAYFQRRYGINAITLRPT